MRVHVAHAPQASSPPALRRIGQFTACASAMRHGALADALGPGKQQALGHAPAGHRLAEQAGRRRVADDVPERHSRAS